MASIKDMLDDALRPQLLFRGLEPGPNESDAHLAAVDDRVLVCDRSGNPSGSDAWVEGKPCTCKPCTILCALADDGVPFIVDASKLPGTALRFVLPPDDPTSSGIEESVEQSRLYKAPLVRVGRVRSGSLREFKDEEPK